MMCPVCQACALRETDGGGNRGAIDTALARATALIEETGARAYTPFVCVERARRAALTGDQTGHTRELREAHRLFTEMGATMRAEKVRREMETDRAHGHGMRGL